MESLNGTLKQSGNLTGEEIPVIIKEKTVVEKDYRNLDNKPSINDVILEGNKTPAELGLTKSSDFELYKQSVDRSFRGVSESIRSVKTESKTYTDNAMEATKAYSDGKNSDLETAINETINNKNNATRAYASHLVSEETDARETADEETLTASKSYTDTAVIKEVTKGPASSLEFEGLQEGIPFPKIILTVPDEYVYEEGKTAHSINIWCNNYSDPDATEQYSENMLVVAKSNTVEIGYDDTIKLLKQVPGKCIVGFSNEEDAAVCTLTVTGALKYEALKRIYSECWNRMDVEKDNMEGYVRGYTDTEITKCKEYTDEKIAEVSDGDITAKGNPVQLDGLQGGVPFSEMVVSGKNLIGIAQAKGLTGDNKNGFLVFDNSASRSIIQKLQPNTTYHIKKYDSGNRFRIVMFDDEPTNTADVNAQQLIYNTDGSISDYTLSTDDYHLWMALATHYATSGEAIEPIVQLEYGDTSTEYEPPITGRELTVGVSGKNLIPYPYQNTNTTHNGVTFTVNNDGSIIANGTATENATFTLWDLTHKFAINSNETYTLSGCPFGGSNTTFALYNIGTQDIDYGDGKTFTEKSDYAPRITIYKGYTANNLVFRPQLEIGDTATEYEPYHGSTVTITPDSNPYTVPNDIRQQDGLNNISVSAGTLSVTGVRKNAAIKRIWEKLDELTTSISYTDEKIGNINTILESVTGGAE